MVGQPGRKRLSGLPARPEYDDQVQLYAFDMLAGDGEDILEAAAIMRKASLARLLARRVDGIFLSDFEQGEIGPIYPGRESDRGSRELGASVFLK